MMTYKEKLKAPQWLQIRKELFSERDRQCEICGSKENMTIHHGYYIPQTDPWDYEKESLWVLCWDCHKKTQLALVTLHRRIGLIHPNSLNEYGGFLKDKINAKEEEDFIALFEKELEEEKKILSEIYMEYSVTITYCSDLGPSNAPDMVAQLVKEFPGIDVGFDHKESGVDGLFIVSGPDENIKHEIEVFLDNYKPSYTY